MFSVSNFAAIHCAYDNNMKGQRVRYSCIGIFGTFYTAFAIFYGTRLREWDNQKPGRCFNTLGIAVPGARHPSVDHIYLAVTAFYAYVLLSLAIMYCRWQEKEQIIRQRQKDILLISSIQFVIHIYMVIALRVSNTGLSNDPSLEQQWGFGQVLALVMFGTTLLECAKSFEGIPNDFALQGHPADGFRVLLVAKGPYLKERSYRS